MIRRIVKVLEKNWDDASSEEIAKAILVVLKNPNKELSSGVMQASLNQTPIFCCEEEALSVWNNTIDAILDK